MYSINNSNGSNLVVALVHNGGMRRRLEVVHLDQDNVKEEVTSGNSEVLDRETDRVVIALSARKGNIQPTKTCDKLYYPR